MHEVSSRRKPVSAGNRSTRRHRPSRFLAHREPVSICEALDRLLNKGAVVVGEATISVAEIDLIHLQLQLVLSSVETAHGASPRRGGSSGADRSWRKEEPTDALNRQRTGPPAEVARESPVGGAPPASSVEECILPGEGRPEVGTPTPGRRDGLAQLVLTLVKLLHELLQRQALRRIEAGSLCEAQIEQLGVALMRQFQEIERLREEFGLEDEDLNLDLGPIGKLF